MRNIAKALFQGLVEMLLAMPLVLFAGIALMEASVLPQLFIGLWLLYPIGAFLGRRLRSRMIGIQMAVLVLLSAGVVFGLAGGVSLGAIGFAALGGFYYYRGVRFMEEAWVNLLPTAALWASFPLYFAVALMMNIYEQYSDYIGWINGFGLANVLLVLFVNNQLHLQTEANSRKSKKETLAASVLSQNRVIMAGFAGIVVLVGLFAQVGDAMGYLKDQLMGLFGGSRGEREIIKDEYVADPQSASGGEVTEGTVNNSWWEQLYMFIIEMIVYVVLIGGVLFLLYFLVKRAGWLSRLLSGWLSGSSRSAALETEVLGYEDEKVQLMDWGKLRRAAADKLRGLREKKLVWSDLTSNRERIRFLYESMVADSVSRGYEYKRHKTPNETGRELTEREGKQSQQKVKETVDSYNLVRYGDAEPDDETVRRIHKLAGK